MEATKTLFVYGTLKKGYGNHRLMEGSTFLGNDQARGIMYGGGAPVVVPTEEDKWVHGEVYEVPAEKLPAIDRLEGHPRGYTRTKVMLRSGREAEIYYWLHTMQAGYSFLMPEGRWPE